MVREDNRLLLGTVYPEIRNDVWAVAVVYNLARTPELHGDETGGQVRYRYVPEETEYINMFRSDTGMITKNSGGPFANPDNFAQYALGQERSVVIHAC